MTSRQKVLFVLCVIYSMLLDLGFVNKYIWGYNCLCWFTNRNG